MHFQSWCPAFGNKNAQCLLIEDKMGQWRIRWYTNFPNMGRFRQKISF